MPFSPSLHSLTAKAMGFSQATPTDGRSYFFDESLFIYRPYQSTAEVLAYLNLNKYRTGHFSIYINTTGTLNPDGSFTGGAILEYMFLNGTNTGDLVQVIHSANTYAALSDAASVNLPTVNTALSTALSGKQATLVSGTSIKTINSATLLGSGDISLPTTYAALTDAASVNLPSTNTALSTALSGKVDKETFSALSGLTWNIGSQHRAEQAIASDTAYTVTGGVNGDYGLLVIETTGSPTVTVNGAELVTRPNGRTGIHAHKLAAGGQYHIYSDYVPDSVSPRVFSAEATAIHTIIMIFDEPVTGTSTGISFNDGGPLTISGMTGSGTNTLTFTIVETMISGTSITYNISGSDLVDTSPQTNPLANTSGTVTNSI